MDLPLAYFLINYFEDPANIKQIIGREVKP